MSGAWNFSVIKIKEEPECERDGNNQMRGLTEIDYTTYQVASQNDCDSTFNSNVSCNLRRSELSFGIAMDFKECKSEELEIEVEGRKLKEEAEIDVKEYKLETESELYKEDHIKKEPADEEESLVYLTDVLYANHDIKEEMVIGPEVLQETIASTSRMSSASPRSREERHVQRALSPHRLLKYSGKDQIIRNPHLNQHQDIVEKPFTCDICQKRFKCKTNLKVHKRDHTGERKLKCDICEKRFRYMSALKSHQRVHTGERPFPCDICERRFNQKHDLIVHQRVHTGEKPFSCDVCGKAFAYKYDMNVHQRDHTGERPFPCDVCEKRFKTKVEFTVHHRGHTGERPFPCDICGKRFNTKNKLKIHENSLSHMRKANLT